MCIAKKDRQGDRQKEREKEKCRNRIKCKFIVLIWQYQSQDVWFDFTWLCFHHHLHHLFYFLYLTYLMVFFHCFTQYVPTLLNCTSLWDWVPQSYIKWQYCIISLCFFLLTEKSTLVYRSVCILFYFTRFVSHYWIMLSIKFKSKTLFANRCAMYEWQITVESNSKHVLVLMTLFLI